jgi:hypothetical protein
MRFRLHTLMILVALNCSLPGTGCIHRVDVTEHYDTIRFTRIQGDSEFHEFATGSWAKTQTERDGHPIASIYVRLEDGTVVFLPEMTKEQAQKIIPGSEGNPETDEWYYNNGNACLFADGKLAGFSTGYPTFSISDRRDGPFYKFPISTKDVRRMFGKPKEVTKFTWPHY